MTNILEKVKGLIRKLENKGKELILGGDLLNLELLIQEELQSLNRALLQDLLEQLGTSKEFRKAIGKLRCSLSLGKLKRRKIRIQIGTGDYIEIESWYATKGRNLCYKGNCHMSLLYWGCIKKASPLYYSRASLVSILCPSFDVAQQILAHFGIKGQYNRMRDLSIALGDKAVQLGAAVLLEQGESLENKRVVISIDGGRSRTRAYTGSVNSKGNATFDTPWKEPKVFVIQILNEQGQPEKKFSLPFYGATMGNIEVAIERLKDALKALQIQKAKAIQFIADGAACFWRRMRQVFISLGVSTKKVTYTLDYYHALEHLHEFLHELVELLPCQQHTKEELKKKFKNFLWDGAIYSIEKRVKQQLLQAEQQMDETLKTALNYFIKHTDRMQYYKFKRNKWLCGSGIMESAIRRIINLRFKSASSFWLSENLESLISLRCIFLAGRWDLFIKNVSKN
ncbi:MAG: hypothetical protein AAF573_03245 [Bacteroidota bacterium]